MSSGPFTYSLSAAAAFVMRSLMEHPQLRTAEAIATAPHTQGEIDADGARAALQELQQHGLADEDADHRWHLTEAGRAARQPT
jgi:predicted ABC-type transport system involved in lysophospholipase L1 biosynthesis ATPase subunit